MRKMQIIISSVLLACCIGFVIFFGINLGKTKDLYEDSVSWLLDIESIQKSQIVVDTTWARTMMDGQLIEQMSQPRDSYATYQYENIQFISYSKEWDEEKLQLLCEELLKNKHGYEIEYLNKVIIRPERDEKLSGYQQQVYNIDIPQNMQGMPATSVVSSKYCAMSNIILYNGDSDTTIESMARVLAHEYGHHFTMFHFNITGDDAKNSKYYTLRNIDDGSILFDYDDIDDYLENHMWYLMEIAANDYVYLMGSPTTKVTEEFYDAKDSLDMLLASNDSAEILSDITHDSFNLKPQENISLPLPDQVKFLPEMFYGAIGETPPQYEDRDYMAQTIQIDIITRYKKGHIYYEVVWNKPWDDKDIVYTLAAYDKDDKLLGGIKSITGDLDAIAYIGETVGEKEDDAMTYFWSGEWSENEFLRLRVIAVFPDGTAAVSPYIDKEFE